MPLSGWLKPTGDVCGVPVRLQNGSVTPGPRDPLHLIVDSQVFEVAEAPGQPGAATTPGRAGRTPAMDSPLFPRMGTSSVAEHEAAIREFLMSINPATGYLD